MKRLLVGVMLLLLGVITFFLYEYNILPHKKYSNEDFQIEFQKSSKDKDEDGVDDQTDILQSVRAYLKTNPKYKSKYYETGYPSDNYGVCTDVVAFGLRGAGYDLMELLHQDVLENRESYNIPVIDKRIDFRRVENLNIYFQRHAISLSTNVFDIALWQGGDIVVFSRHVGIVSDKRNFKGIPFVLHHANSYQIFYEEDILEREKNKIIGHYRWTV